MKTEYKCLIYTMINNLVIFIIKICGGILFNLSSLIADGLHTFSDFITDIISLITIKISNKKPTKLHPFGFGKLEYISNLFIGIVIFIIGILTIVNSFSGEYNIPSLKILYFLSISIILKLIAVIIMHKLGLKINSEVLITSEKESKADVYSSLGVTLIVILLQFSSKIQILKHSDMIGTLIIGILIIKTAISVIFNNILLLVGEIEIDNLKLNKIKEILNSYESIKKSNIKLIKYGFYYKLELNLELDSKLTLRKISKLEKKIKKVIKKEKELKVKHISIYVTDKLE